MTEASDKVARLEQTWRMARGFPGILAEVNNQPIGKRFMVTAFIFFLLGGVLALLMRVQLVVPENNFLGPQVFNELFTMHGSTMMFLFAVPFLEGLALYLLPMMLGSRDVAFPRLTAYGYWVYLLGGLIFYASFLFGAVPEVGWFGYTPLSTARFTGMSTDFWLLGLSMVEVAGLTAAVEIVVTILKFRAPGMTLGRMPLFAWAMLVVGIMIIFAFTVLLTATVLLEMDRAMDTRFFDVHRGGNNLLWQHLFWFFGHPEVYIMFLPATGIVSMIVAVAARRAIIGYVLIAMAIVVTGFVSFGLWVHHMFAAGLPEMAMSFFTAASLMIAIASGVQIFAWIATLWGSAPSFQPPLLFVLGFIFVFVLGGMTGVMVAIVPFDVQVHDTYFIVAHFHYVLIGGVVFPIFAGLHYWTPKVTGRLLSGTLGKWSFWLEFIGFNLTFFPMHIMGFLGMPRRVFTYATELELDAYNIVATTGSFLLASGVLVFVINVAWSLWRGEEAGANPWHADSLEWSTTSPPPMYTFFDIPAVGSRHPNWPLPTDEPIDPAIRRIQQALSGEPQQWRGALVTDALDARPQAIQYLPGPTYVPLWAALGTAAAAVGVLARTYILAGFGAVVFAVAVVLWLLPRKQVRDMLRESDLPERTGLPVFTSDTRATGWWGTLSFIAILGTAFGALAYSYFYIRLFSDVWPQDDIAPPTLWLPGAAYGLLALSAASQAWGIRCFRRDERWGAQLGLGLTLLLGASFLVLQLYDLWRYYPQFISQDPFVPGFVNAYGSLFYVTAGTLILAVMTGLALNAAAQLRVPREFSEAKEAMALHVENTALYWLSIVVMGLLVFAMLYLSPHVL